MTVFFIIDSKTKYIAFLGSAFLGCIPSSLYQVLIFWDGKSIVVHPADNQLFKANMFQAHYYDGQVRYITLQGFTKKEGRISVQKAIEVVVETIRQDSTRPRLADLVGLS